MLSIRLYQPRPGSPLQAALGPACDQCRRKKARCNRQRPCQTCARGQKSCSYDAIPKARGRRPRSNSKKESSGSPGSVRSSGTDGLAPRVDASETAMSPLEAPCDDAIITKPWDLPNTSDSTSSATVQPIQLNPTNESETPLQTCETDTSSDCTSPLILQRQTTIESYISEDTGTPGSRYPHLIESEPGLWGSSEGAADLLQPSFCMLPRSVFVPYVRVFVERLYPVFPVIDKDNLLALLEQEGHEEQPISTSLYAFLTALCAAVIVQLNVADMGLPETHNANFNENDNNTQSSLHLRSSFSAQFFVAQCMQARQQQGFIEDPDEWTILTSFFLFAYHGNLCQSQAAWYFLREAIGFIHALRLDERDTYKSFDAEAAQRRRRIFWLLFITERAYAIQHRRRAVLRPTIDLPRIFESRDPKLAYGFVTLAKVFASVDEDFINAWREQSPVSAGNALQKSNYSADRYLYNNDVEGVLSEIEETQRLDILVTDYWLRVLACQLRMGHLSQSVAESRESNAYCVLDTSRKLLQIISTANLNSLESHGIGMEQKISDVASCLCDILAGLNANQFSTEFFSAPDFLHNFMVFLASFRNHESQYFQPLAQKATTVLAARLEPSSFPLAPEEQATNQNARSYEGEPLWTKF